MSLALLACLELANVERTASEGPLGRLYSSPLSILHRLEADEAKAKHVVAASLRASLGLLSLHKLQVCDCTERVEKLDKFVLGVLD